MSIGVWQLVLILVIVFIVFGAGKLPSLMGDVGKGVRNLKEGLKGEGAEKEGDEEIVKQAIEEAKEEAKEEAEESAAKEEKKDEDKAA